LSAFGITASWQTAIVENALICADHFWELNLSQGKQQNNQPN
jgi:hypothetical protein